MIREKIIKKITDNNQPITIEKYIEYCLYDDHGYYTNGKILVKSGDFITAHELSQLFGEIIGLSIYSFWKNTIKYSNKLKFNIFKRLKVFGNKANDLKSTIEYILARSK